MTNSSPARDSNSRPFPIITAHRGASGLAPENTLPAIQRAMEAKAEYAEVDVQVSADGHIVLFHDMTLDRITGKSGSVRERTWMELQTLDAGEWFHGKFQTTPPGNSTESIFMSEAPDVRFDGTVIPDLNQVIDTVRGKMKLNIELKTTNRADRLPELVVRLVERKEFVDQCVVTSSDRAALQRVKEINPHITAGYVFSEIPEKSIWNSEFEWLLPHRQLLRQQLVTRIHASGKAVHVWTVNEVSEMKNYVELGVDGILTDFPDRLVMLRERYQQ